MLTIDEILSKGGGICLDVACGGNKMSPLWVGMDLQELPGVDIVHDINIHPWPLPDESCKLILASHIVEHIPGVAVENGHTRFPFLEFMNECWRVLKYDGEIAIAAPYGTSPGFLQDPTHIHPVTEATWIYFDPLHESKFYKYYQPRPWKIKSAYWSPSENMEVVLIKRRDDPSYHE